jgi:hypothetical protein
MGRRVLLDDLGGTDWRARGGRDPFTAEPAHSGAFIDAGSPGCHLQTVAEIQTDLLAYLPPIHEAEVTQFSSDVAVKQAFTTGPAGRCASCGLAINVKVP